MTKDKNKNDKNQEVVAEESAERRTIVAIGASAGGLEALRELVAQLPHSPKYTYVVAQHLSPTHASLMTELLGRETKLHVETVTSGVDPQPSTIYIAPPNHDVEVREAKLWLEDPSMAVGPRPSINRLFASLAKDQGENSIGVILSGTGSDGASGLQAIKAAEGVTIVQEVQTAKYDGMPNAAIRTGAVDMVLPPAEIGKIISSLSGLTEEERSELVPHEEPGIYEQIIQAVTNKSGFDLGQYKVTTVQRRIQRRMSLFGLRTYEQYLDYLNGHSDEHARLIRDVFISVTEFFRDAPAFEQLSELVTKIVAQKEPLQPVRVWVPGCASGEEAYSIAILFEEAIRQQDRPVKYQIFATDIDESVTAVGRRGIYHASSLEKLDNKIRERYFEAVGAEFQIVKPLRDRIVFAQHNLIQDPPFSRVDLVSCRNLLIYFTPPNQRRILEIFHYSLLEKGYLFLGKSESVDLKSMLFSVEDKSARIFRKRGGQSALRYSSSAIDLASSAASMAMGRATLPPTLPERIQQTVAEIYSPTSIVVADNDEVLYSVGNVKSVLNLGAGPTRLNVFDLVDERLRIELRALLYKCRREGGRVDGAKVPIELDGRQRAVQISVNPLLGDDDNLVMVSFEIGDQIAIDKLGPEAGWEDTIIRELEHELDAKRAHLQIVVEELETSNEELQSLNEELQSSNEELQATNEELQTTNEELQSTNEELLTVNEELQVKSSELETTNNDLLNIKRSIDFPLLVVDKKLAVTRFNKAAEALFPIKLVNQGDHLASIPWRYNMPLLRHDVESVVESGKSEEKSLVLGDRYFQLRIMPYRGNNDGAEGAVLTFSDTTEMHRIENKLLENEELQAIFNQSFQSSVILTTDGVVIRGNEQAAYIFDPDFDRLIGQPYWKAACWSHSDLIQQKVKKMVAEAAAGRSARQEIEMLLPDGQLKTIDLSLKPVHSNGDGVVFLIAEGRDISALKQAEVDLFNQKERAQITLHSIGDGVVTTDINGVIEFLNPVAERLTGWSSADAKGKPHGEVMKIVDEQSRVPIENPLDQALARGEVVELSGHALLLSRSGDEYAVEDSAAPIRDHDGKITGAVMVFHDVTEKQEILREVSWQAVHDPLTGQINRRGLEKTLDECLSSALNQDKRHVFLYVDLDQFKLVNDTCGHVAGDELLRQVCGLLQQKLRSVDTLARLGGDEFGIVLEGCNVEHAVSIGQKILDELQNFRFVWQDKTFAIGASIGMVEINQQSHSTQQILSNADEACFIAKDKGRNRVHYYHPEDGEVLRQKGEMEWVTRLNDAFENERFELHCQPIVSLNGDADHMEVFIRMRGDDDQLVPPMAFIPAAERYNVITEIDRWVIKHVFGQCHGHCLAGDANKKFFINISGATLGDERFYDYVTTLFEQYQVSPRSVCFEITETTAISNLNRARELITDFKKLGCQFALDDFGSGVSTFSYLKNLPVDYIKVDGGFVQTMLQDPVNQAVIESINTIGHLMGIKTIAEYVENDEVLDRLKEIGVDFAQGFGLDMPRPIAECQS